MALLTGRKRAFGRGGAPYGMAFGSGFPPGYGFSGGRPSFYLPPAAAGLDPQQQALLAQLIQQINMQQQSLADALARASAAGIPPQVIQQVQQQAGGARPPTGAPTPAGAGAGGAGQRPSGAGAGGAGGVASGGGEQDSPLRPRQPTTGSTLAPARNAGPYRPPAGGQQPPTATPLGPLPSPAPGFENALAGARYIGTTNQGILVQMGDGSIRLAPPGSMIGTPTEPTASPYITSGTPAPIAATVQDNTVNPDTVGRGGPNVEGRGDSAQGGLQQQPPPPQPYPTGQPVPPRAPQGSTFNTPTEPTGGALLTAGATGQPQLVKDEVTGQFVTPEQLIANVVARMAADQQRAPTPPPVPPPATPPPPPPPGSTYQAPTEAGGQSYLTAGSYNSPSAPPAYPPAPYNPNGPNLTEF